jgi:hypothetical protein
MCKPKQYIKQFFCNILAVFTKIISIHLPVPLVQVLFSDEDAASW